MQSHQITTAVEAANILINALPDAGKLAVLDHLIRAVDTKNLSTEAKNQLLALLPKGPSLDNTLTIESERKTYPDLRPGVDHHAAIDYTVRVNREITARNLLTELLGNDAEILMIDWADRIDFTKQVPTTSSVALFLNSNYKDRYTQGIDFEKSGITFADDLEATIVCATLVKKAKDAGLDLSQNFKSWKSNSEALCKLTETEQALLSKLRDGVVRSRSGALVVADVGRLRANYFGDGSIPDRWAFGSGAPAESRS